MEIKLSGLTHKYILNYGKKIVTIEINENKRLEVIDRVAINGKELDYWEIRALLKLIRKLINEGVIDDELRYK